MRGIWQKRKRKACAEIDRLGEVPAHPFALPHHAQCSNSEAACYDCYVKVVAVEVVMVVLDKILFPVRRQSFEKSSPKSDEGLDSERKYYIMMKKQDLSDPAKIRIGGLNEIEETQSEIRVCSRFSS